MAEGAYCSVCWMTMPKAVVIPWVMLLHDGRLLCSRCYAWVEDGLVPMKARRG